MQVKDFAKLNTSYNTTGATRKWEIVDVEKLRLYFEQCEFRPSTLAKELNVSYSGVRRLLVKAGLWDQAKIRNVKSGGRKRTSNSDKFGYQLSDETYRDEAGDLKRKYVHHVVAEKKLGRPLNPGEQVHHVNLDKTDNRPENLIVCDSSTHRKMHQDLEHLAGRLIEAGYISFVPETEQYVFVGPSPKLKYELGGGFVEVVDVLGSDATVVNAARVSFGKRIDQIREQDKKLLDYLAKNGHTSPFRHCYVQLHVKAPEFVARQWYKHVVGSEYSFKDQPWNEISGRYVEYDVEAWIPPQLRKQSLDKKQGSSDQSVDDEAAALEKYKAASQLMFETYKELLGMGVCKEQARTILGLNFYTEWYWTTSLQTVHHFVKLRTDAHAQVEIQEYANIVNDAMLSLFPNAWRALS